jgi:hypothetical protein
MRPKKYLVSLTEAERAELARWANSQRHSERARILLLADEAREGGATKDADIAAHVRGCLPTVTQACRIRARNFSASQPIACARVRPVIEPADALAS